MAVPVTPGGAYFGFYSDFGDVERGAVFPGDPLPEPPSAFWTRFIAPQEIV